MTKPENVIGTYSDGTDKNNNNNIREAHGKNT